MKLLELHLLCFGAFEDLHLDLSAPGLHVVHGPNGVGKSTALRAVGDFLYGIPEQSRDVHASHRASGAELRIGARVLPPDAAEVDAVSLVRRKGRKKTLLDADGAPFDEALFERWKGGISRELFQRSFGLSHESLVRGGRALAEGGGDLGESLFGAGAGLPELHRLVRDLEAEARALYLERGQVPALNAALKGLKEARKQVREATLRPREWLDLDARRQEVADALALAVDAQRRATADRERLERTRRVLGRVHRRASLLAARAKLGDVPPLPADAAASWAALRAERSAVEVERRRLLREREECAAALAELPPPDPVLAHEAALATLAEALAVDARQRDEAAQLGDRLDALRDETRRELSQLGVRPAGPAQGVMPELDTRAATRLRALIRDHAAAESEAQGLAREAARLGLARERLGAPPAPPPDTRELSRVVRALRQQGDLESELAAARQVFEARSEELQRRVAALPHYDGAPEALASLALPAAETIERFAREEAAHEREIARIHDARLLVRSDLDDACARIAQLEVAGEVPTREGLASLRAGRDGAWSFVRDAWLEQRALPPVERAQASRRFEEALHEADTAGDRLREDATRAARHAAALLDRERGEQELADLAAAHEAALAARAETRARWQASWAPLGIEALSPEEMRGWRSEAATLRERVGDREEARARQDLLAARVDSARARVLAALSTPLSTSTPVSTPLSTPDDSLEALLAHAERQLEDASAVAEALRDHTQKSDALAEQEALLAQRRAERAVHEESWAAEWTRQVSAVGLAPGSRVEEAQGWLEAHGRLAANQDEIERGEERIARWREETRALAARVRALCAEVAPELCDQAHEVAGPSLLDRFRVAQQQAHARNEFEMEASALDGRLGDLEEDAGRLDASVGEWVRRARCEREEEIDGAIARSEEARVLEAECQALEGLLCDEGLPLEELVHEVLACDADALPLALAAARDEADAALERCNALREQSGGLAARLAALDGGPAAADAAAALASRQAEVETLAERYAQLVAERLLLAREIERYRAAHQGPVLKGAAERFTRLTGGAYTDLCVEIGEDDVPRLAAERAGGERVAVPGLSDGTRDQLYLALRLASMERHLAGRSGLPVVLDDVLVQFDDARAAEGLALFSELASELQVLLFTHHERVVEQAQALGPGVTIHHLAGREGVGRG